MSRKQQFLVWFRRFKENLLFLMSLLGLLWLVEIANFSTGHALNQFGILPREWIGLRGILLAPLLHANNVHLMANSLPFLMLGGMTLFRGRKQFWETTGIIVVLGGLLLWGMGRPGIHVGASALIFGYFGFLVAGGWYAKKFSSAIAAVITVFLYGGMIYGALPQDQMTVSWEGHLFGMVSGVLAARILR